MENIKWITQEKFDEILTFLKQSKEVYTFDGKKIIHGGYTLMVQKP